MNKLILANGDPVELTSMEIHKIGNNFTEIVLHHCTLPIHIEHLKLFEIISPTDEEYFLNYTRFKECAVRASSSQLELFIENLNDFTLVSRRFKSCITNDPKIYTKYLLQNL